VGVPQPTSAQTKMSSRFQWTDFELGFSHSFEQARELTCYSTWPLWHKSPRLANTIVVGLEKWIMDMDAASLG
jgi:hypothetical protein